MGLWGLSAGATAVVLGCVLVPLLVTAVSMRLGLQVALPAVVLALLTLYAHQGGTARRRGRPTRTAGRSAPSPASATFAPAHSPRSRTGCESRRPWRASTSSKPRTDEAGRFGLVHDTKSGTLTATLRCAASSTWLVDGREADGWVSNWHSWLASLGYAPAVRWVNVTVDSAPESGTTLRDRVRDPPRPGRARRRPGTDGRAGPPLTRGSRARRDPRQHHLRPGRHGGQAARAARPNGRGQPPAGRVRVAARLLRRHGARPRDGCATWPPSSVSPTTRRSAAMSNARVRGTRPGRLEGRWTRCCPRGVGPLPARLRRLGHLGLARGAAATGDQRRPHPAAVSRPVPEARHACCTDRCPPALLPVSSRARSTPPPSATPTAARRSVTRPPATPPTGSRPNVPRTRRPPAPGSS